MEQEYRQFKCRRRPAETKVNEANIWTKEITQVIFKIKTSNTTSDADCLDHR